MRKIIIDCDPGHDDVIASLVALAHPLDLKILGFTTVCGNNSLKNVTNNILKIEDHLGIQIPVSVGARTPLKRKPEPQFIAHGKSGLDGPKLKKPISKPIKLSAVEFIKKCLVLNNKVTIVAIGPLTNIALFIKKYPKLKKRIKEIVIMGGSVYSGNILAKSEFNIYHDPEAAKIVLNSKIPITLAPLEVCEAGAFKLKDIKRFKGKGKVSKLVYDLLNFYSKYAINHNLSKTPIFDMTTIIYLLKPSIFKYKMMNVDVELNGKYTRGMTVCTLAKDKTYINNLIKVLLDVDNKKFVDIFIKSIFALDKKYKGGQNENRRLLCSI